MMDWTMALFFVESCQGLVKAAKLRSNSGTKTKSTDRSRCVYVTIESIDFFFRQNLEKKT